jgi:hypothetical protein
MNEILISAYSLRHSLFDNCLEIFSLQLSRFLVSSHYERVRTRLSDSVGIDLHLAQEMGRLQRLMDDLNQRLFNPSGLNILWPRKVGFIFVSSLLVSLRQWRVSNLSINCIKLEIEYYVSWQLGFVDAAVVR